MINEKPAGNLDPKHPQRKFYYCYECGEPFWKPDAFRKIYCCPKCQRAAYAKAHPKKEKAPKALLKKKCEWCGETFETEYSTKKYCSKECGYQANLKKKREQWADAYISKTRVCKECGTEFMTECGDKHSVFCCKACADKHERRAEHKTERHRIYMRGQKKQRKQQVARTDAGDVDFNSLFERDNGICQICGMDVHWVKHIDNNWDGTIDHIVPLSLGGEHSMDNCQLAHRVCNSIKLKATADFSINWEEKSKGNNYWRKKYEDYKALMST